MPLQDLFPLPAQDYLVLARDLAGQCYQFAIANPYVAGGLMLSVWLLCTVFYSLRIAVLKGRIKKLDKTGQELTASLDTTREQNQQLQVEIATCLQHLETEQQRGLALQERIAEIGGQIAEAIVGLAARPELGQQGLSVSPGLQPEQLWQRFSAAVRHLGESLLAERGTSGELRQAVEAEAAKVAEKNLQLQSLQFRFDTQKQQLTSLEADLAAQRTELEQQQALLTRQLAEQAAEHRAELERREQLAAAAKPQPLAQPVPSPQPEPEPAAILQPAAEPVPEIAVVTAEPAPAVDPVAVSAEPESSAPEPVAPAAESARAGGMGGKFKSMFGTSADKTGKPTEPGKPAGTGKLKSMFGSSAAKAAKTEAAAPVATAADEPVPAPAAASAAGLGKLKSMFGSSAAKPAAVAQSEPVPAQPAVAREVPEMLRAEPQAAATVQPDATPKAARSGGMFSGLQQRIAKLDAMFEMKPQTSAEPAAEAVEPAMPQTPVATQEPAPEAVDVAAETGKPAGKSLFGRFKR